RAGGNVSLTIERLRELEDTLRSSHLPYLMLVIPARHQIRPSVEPATRVLSLIGMDGLVYRQNQDVIAHFYRAHVPYLDLLPALVRADRTARVSFQQDSHWNTR